MTQRKLTPFERWMVARNLARIRAERLNAADVVALLAHNGYARVASELERIAA